MTRQRPPHLQLIAIDGKEVVGACHQAVQQYRSVDAFDLDSMEQLVLSVTRHLCASLASEAMRGWECAHDLAEAALGLSDGPTLVAHVAALLRAVRAERQQGFAYMSADCPMCSLRITDEELLIVRLLRAARSNARQEVVQTRSRACAEKRRSPHCRCGACARQPAHRVCCRLRAAGTSLRAAGRDGKRAGRQQWGLSFPVSGRRSRRSAPSMNDLATVRARSRQEDDIISRASSGRPLRSPSRPPRHRLRPSVRR